MNEKVYGTMRNTGIINIIFGITTIVIGAATGVVMIVCGAKLLRRKSEIMF